jgi:hypothetical protein
MYRALRSSGRRRPLEPQTFATIGLIAALATVLGLFTVSGASVAATSQDKPADTSLPTISGSAVENGRL